MRWYLVVGVLMLASRVDAQSAAPVLLRDLPTLSARWPAPWAELVAEIVAPRDGFEETVLSRIAKLLAAAPPAPEAFQRADIVMSAALRHHLSMHRPAPLLEPPGNDVAARLQDRLTKIRCEWLEHLQKAGANADAIRLAERWLPGTPNDHALRTNTFRLWVHEADLALQSADFATARRWLNRLEAELADPALTMHVRKELQARAEAILKLSAEMPDAQAIRALDEALSLWPRLPDARDILMRRKGALRTLVVGVRTLPTHLSPLTANTETEKQSLDLLFDKLLRAERLADLRYHAQLATTIPSGGMTASVSLRRDIYWSNGERLTAADVRHTALLMDQTDPHGSGGLWRDFLHLPRYEGGPFSFSVGYRQGLFNPLGPLTFCILPQHLQRGDDPKFALAPIGSGPFQYTGQKDQEGQAWTVFQANPHDLRSVGMAVRAIHMRAWSDASKDLGRPLPPLILDAPTSQLSALKQLGYSEIKISRPPRVYYLALNHRREGLQAPDIRRAIAHAIDRQALLARYFRGDTAKGKYHSSANGLFPGGSWANASAPAVPEELHDQEKAASFARAAKQTIGSLNWTLKCPSDDAATIAACTEIARVLAKLFEDAQVKADIKVQALPPASMHKAMKEHDYDLAYTSVEHLDDPVRLTLFFQRQPNSPDAKLHELLRTALQYRQFSPVRENMQSLHVHLNDTMPVIPLWQLDLHILTLPTLQLPPLEARSVFANVREWKLTP